MSCVFRLGWRFIQSDPIGAQVSGSKMITDPSFSRGNLLRPYCLMWRRRGFTDSFQHFVIATSVLQAVDRSRTEIRLTLASNSVLWELDAIVAKGNETAELADGPPKPEPRDSGGFYAWLIGASFVFAMMLLPIWQHREEPVLQSSDEHSVIPNETSADAAPSLINVERAPLEISLPGVVYSDSIVDVRAPGTGRFVASDLCLGGRVIAGEIIGEFEASLDPAPCELRSSDASWRCGSENGSSGDDGPDRDGTVTAPISGILVPAANTLEATDVSEGALLAQIVPASGLRVRIPSHRAHVDPQQACEFWKDGSFLSFGVIIRAAPGKQSSSYLSLGILDQFAAVFPGMKVEVRCKQPLR